VHVALQLPQLAASVLSTMHLPPHTVSPSWHAPVAPPLAFEPPVPLEPAMLLDPATSLVSPPAVELPEPSEPDAPLDPGALLGARTQTFEFASHS